MLGICDDDGLLRSDGRYSNGQEGEQKATDVELHV